MGDSRVQQGLAGTVRDWRGGQCGTPLEIGVTIWGGLGLCSRLGPTCAITVGSLWKLEIIVVGTTTAMIPISF